MTNKKWIFKSKPEGRVKKSDFEWIEETVSDLKDDEFLVRNIYMSMDPAMRAWVMGDTYIPGTKQHQVMRGRTIGIVEKSNTASFPVGSIVSGMLGWQLYAVTSGKDLDGTPLRVIPTDSKYPLTAYFSLFGIVGYTAYFGVLDVCSPKKGETFVVSAASGAVGSLAGQIAKLKGCRVIGLAGTKEKCDWITSELGFDGAINYKTEDVSSRLSELCPDGIDIYFENVGGEILDLILEKMNWHGRVAVCGLISQYNAEGQVPGPYRFMDVLMKRLRVQGFICRDYLDRVDEAHKDFEKWLDEDQIKHRIQIEEGIERAPDIMNMLFDGQNVGKLILQLSDDPRKLN